MPSWTNATDARATAAPPPGRRLAPTTTAAGILRPDELPRYATLARPPSSPLLDGWVEWYWSVRWDLPDGQRYLSEVLPHPALHLSIQSGQGSRHGHSMPAAVLTGVVTTRFTVELVGAGRVIAVKFRPGGLGAFTGRDVGAWLDRVVDLRTLFGDDATRLRDDVLRTESDIDRALLLDAFLLERRPAPDPRYDRVLAVVADMLADHTLTRVDDVTERHGIPLRSLQRLFRRYVGVGPKWVLQRYRLHDAVSLIDAGGVDDLAALAASLGWYDQAHFTREFTALVGMPPARYAAQRAAAPAHG